MEQRAHFIGKLDEMNMMVLRMAAMSEKAVHKSIQAFLENNSELAQQVIDEDVDVNEIEEEIDRFNLEILALDQPMAGDLRKIVGASRITVNLERLGDEAVNMAHRALFLSTRPPLPYDGTMEKLTAVCKDMLSMSLKAFVDLDVKLSEEVCQMDNEADDLSIRLLKAYINSMVSETRIVERGVHAIMAARHLERIADLATNVAETVIFVVEGDNVKHRCRS